MPSVSRSHKFFKSVSKLSILVGSEILVDLKQKFKTQVFVSFTTVTWPWEDFSSWEEVRLKPNQTLFL